MFIRVHLRFGVSSRVASNCSLATEGFMRIGIYGGTFDPVHHGHLILARQALEEFKLDRLVFVPAAESPFKIHNHTAPATDRLAMLHSGD